MLQYITKSCQYYKTTNFVLCNVLTIAILTTETDCQGLKTYNCCALYYVRLLIIINRSLCSANAQTTSSNYERKTVVVERSWRCFSYSELIIQFECQIPKYELI